MRIRGILGLMLGVALLCPGASSASVAAVGETFDAESCNATGSTYFPTAPSEYVIPSPGVLTSWSYTAGDHPAQLKFKVARIDDDEGSGLILGESLLKHPPANATTSYPTRISVQEGDVIGMYLATEGECGRLADSSYEYLFTESDPDVNTTPLLLAEDGYQIDIAAVLESDADNDGFGDETQDLCPAVASTTGCPIPNTKITKHPNVKGKRKQVTFKFRSNQAGATFKCSLDGGPLRSCLSPRVIKVGTGKHVFQVVATNPDTDLTDATPASYTFKVVKKKHKRHHGRHGGSGK
jgi:hypothetical protein